MRPLEIMTGSKGPHPGGTEHQGALQKTSCCRRVVATDKKLERNLWSWEEGRGRGGENEPTNKKNNPKPKQNNKKKGIAASLYWVTAYSNKPGWYRAAHVCRKCDS